METKKCSKCGEVKSTSEFDKSTRNKGGFRGQCRACRALYHKEYYLKNLARCVANRKEWRANNKEKANKRASELKTEKRYLAESLLSPDHTCQHPGCTATESHGKYKSLQFHEINGRPARENCYWWVRLSEDDPETFQKTTLLLCRKHHDEVHNRAPHRVVLERAKATDNAKDLTIAKLTTLVIVLYAQLKQLKEL